MSYKILGAALLLAGLLSGCDQHYRYACQDPSNWDQDYCKKPLCEVNKDCPEHIFGEKEKADITLPAPASKPTTGDCK